MPKLMKSKWFTLTVLFLLCGGVAVSTWVRGELDLGPILAIALVLLVADRSVRCRRRLFDTDERQEAIGLFAGMWTGYALFLALFVCFLVETARGHSGEPYDWLLMLYVGLFFLFGIARSVRK
jgi:hypothetical protein